MENINLLFLLAGLLLFISVLASTLSARLGMPLLLLFLGVGMLAGENGPGGIVFNDFQTASTVSQLALAIILLDGGLRTRANSFRVVLKPASVLATWGVIATAGLLGAFATWLLDVDWRLGLLLGSIVGSTDAAAVFSLLRNSGVRLNERVKNTLEVESGANDPMAILLVTVLVEVLLFPEHFSTGKLLLLLATQAGLGLVFGYGGGWILSRLLARLSLAEGAYPLLIASGGLFAFSAANLLNGSGCLAIYIAGVIIGNRRNHATAQVLHVMDSLAWLAQAGMFVVLGLLVTPTNLLHQAWEALAMALFLMLVARPFAVLVGLKPFRYTLNEMAFVSWVGLRGAVPVVLAIVPVVMGVPDSTLLFNVAFAVVLLSLLVQGATIPAAARLLRVELPPTDEAHDHREVWVGHQAVLPLHEYRVAENARAVGRHPDDLASEFSHIRAVAVVREDRLVDIDHATRLAHKDAVWFIVEGDSVTALARQFGNNASDLKLNVGYFGSFSISGESLVSDLAMAYGIDFTPEELKLDVQTLVVVRLGRPPVTGDRVRVGELTLVVREMDERGRINLIGLKFPNAQRRH